MCMYVKTNAAAIHWFMVYSLWLLTLTTGFILCHIMDESGFSKE